MTKPDEMPPIGGSPTPGSPSDSAPEAAASAETLSPAPPAAQAAATADAEPAAPAREKIDWGQRLLDNKVMVFAFIGLLVLAGVGGWWYLLESQVAEQAPVAAASYSQMDALTQAAAPPETREPLAAVDQAMAEQARPGEEEHEPEEFLNTQPAPITSAGITREPTLTQAQKNENRARAEQTARAANQETVQTTQRDPQTGQYSQQATTRQRVRVGPAARREEQQWSATATGNMDQAAAGPPRPARDKDGTPFETNDEINLMLANLPAGVHQNYERMTGRRYRPLLAGQQRPAGDGDKRRAEMAYVPGMDGFNTVRFRGSNANPADEELILPDVFYRCSIQGTQLVRTGSVVMLRLSEEATFGGVTFPRNMIFAALASVESNRVTLQIERLGQYKVGVEVYNYSYMPGIAIDPAKRLKPQGQEGVGGAMMQSGTQEISTAILQSSQAANSWQGIAGRAGVTMLGRLPRGGVRLRDVTLPDGYPVLVTRAASSQGGGGGRSYQQGGVLQPTGPQGQEGNPMQSPLMQGVGQGGYPGQPGYDNLPPAYAQPAPQSRQR